MRKPCAPEDPDNYEHDGGPLFARARNTDPGTSHAAARSQTPKKMTKLRHVVLDTFIRYGPMDDTVLVSRIAGYTPSGIRTRRSELVEMGLVEDTGIRVRLATGRLANVWKAVHEAPAATIKPSEEKR